MAHCIGMVWSRGRNHECGNDLPCPHHSVPPCAACASETRNPDADVRPLREHTCDRSHAFTADGAGGRQV